MRSSVQSKTIAWKVEPVCAGFETSPSARRSRGPSDRTPFNMVNLGLAPQAIICRAFGASDLSTNGAKDSASGAARSKRRFRSEGPQEILPGF
jgi:hypothetical protein